jgi:hypothetical protein
MPWIRAVVLALATASLAGCAYNDHFDNRVARYDVAAEQARDQMILTNIVRASHAEPMSFIQLGQLSGSNTSTAVVGLPALLLGPLSPVAATAALQKETIFGASVGGGQGFVGNQASTAGSTNFQATPAETKDFYRGLLSQVEPYTVQFFVEQGVSRELLFYLFTNTVIEDGREVRNDPLDQNYGEFEKIVKAAMEYGLSTEEIPGAAKHGRPAKAASAGAKAPSASGSDSSDESVSNTQLCFDRGMMTPGVPPVVLSPICGTPEISPDPRTVIFRGMHVAVIPRSVFGIFQFLGRAMAAGERGRIILHSSEAIDEGPFKDDLLFDVQQGGGGSCFLSVDYEGATYCVPLQGAENTKRIISMITQLLALNTSIQDIPITPIVQTLP